MAGIRAVLITIASLATTSLVACQKHTSCDDASYYSSVSDLTNRDELHSHVKSTHRASLPYTSGDADDVWDALASLDSDETGQDVLLVYGDRYAPLVPHDDGSCDRWNREHLWPRSRGVGKSGRDNTDLHHIRPADCNVNSARGNLLFGSCATSPSECTSPAHPEAAADTQSNSVSFLPPVNERGNIARSIFYMDLRYDGDEADVENLVVTDCPEVAPDVSMGFLSQLLQWHIDDPPDELEKKRNDSICKDWQGNRNPFIDHPSLVASYFGKPRQISGNGVGYDCSVPPPAATPSARPTLSSGSTALPPSSQSGRGTCLGMEQGDIAIIGVKSLDPDAVFFVALADLPVGSSIYMSDNAWTGSSLKSNEGLMVLSQLDTPTGITRGSIFGFDPSSSTTLDLGVSWSKISGDFALSASGDNVMIYCINEDENINVISAALFQTGWSEENSDDSSFSTGQSARPRCLPHECTIGLIDKKKNWWYRGTRRGTKSDLLNSISDPSNWSGDNVAFDLNTDEEFDVNVASMRGFGATDLLCLALASLFTALWLPL